MKVFLRLLFVTTVSFLLLSCAQKSYLQKYVKSTADINRIALFPLNSDSTQVDLISNNEYFYNLLYQRLNNKTLIDNELVLESFDKVLSESPDNLYNELTRIASQNVEADAFIYGFLKFYKEREGSDFGVKSPAVVNFVVYLVEVETNLTLWSYEFDESQLPLFSDVSQIKKFLKRKGKWITADELFKEGLEQTASKLSDFLR